MEIPRHWRLKAQRYRLEGSACPHCGQFIFPPRPVCPRCTDRLTRILSWDGCYYPSTTFRVEPSNKYSKAKRAISLMQVQQRRDIVIMT